MLPTTFVNLDIELTNRCNAKCYFCPRDATPHQGLMSPETFEQSLARAVELRPVVEQDLGRELKISLCGLGEPLLNPRAADAVRRVVAEGFECGMASNGALLNEERAHALLDAGLAHISINVGEEGESYEDIYKLPFERTLDNVVRFAELAEGRCQVQIVLVDHRRDPGHREHMMDFWRQRGLEDFVVFPIMNRGGALFVDHMQFDQLPQRARAEQLLAARGDTPLCYAPFVFLFVGYDGQHYLCCSDWRKEAAMGSVFDRSFLDVLGDKLDHLLSREPVCKTCNIDPRNRLTDELRAVEAGDPETRVPEELADELMSDSAGVVAMVEAMQPGSSARLAAPTVRRRIPVSPA